ncbi:MAG TPA: ParB/RepB/Spo0J family partition protein [Alphaproteobacteria bacterium]|nr:ParB/RepB/Spo0J family partition protein [Alphaproteobacteria bacterium]
MTAPKPLTKPAPLGRGLSALFGDADASYQAKPIQPRAAQSAPVVEKAGSRTMPLAWLQPGAYQPRRHFDEEALKGLADSIRERGILEPLLVRPVSEAKDAYEIIAGERRWRAAQIAGLHDVPVLVREISDREALEFGLIENIQRQDLSPLEEAEGYQRLIEEFKYTQDTLAKIVGKSRPHIANMLRILTLPPAVKQMITDGEITLGHARALVTAKNPLALAQEIAKKGLNVRQAENLAKEASGKISSPKSAREPEEKTADVVMLEKELERVIGLKVKINTEGKAGSLTLYYKDLDQLDEIIKKLRG